MAETTSSIQFALYANKLKSKEEIPFVAKVLRLRNMSHNQIVDIMAKRNTTVTRQDIIVVLDLFEEVVAEQLLNGNTVSASFFNAHTSIRGAFDTRNEDFSGDRHELKISLCVNPRFKKRITSAALLERITAQVAHPEIYGIVDYKSKTADAAVTPGNVAEINGINLLMSGDNPEEGVFFINRETKQETRAADIIRNSTKQVVIMAPDSLDPSALYDIVVRCASGTIIRESRWQPVIETEAVSTEPEAA